MGLDYTDEQIDEYNKNYLKKYIKDSNLNQAMLEYQKGRPVQYIVGNVDFLGNIIDVDERVLIPRFETEELVEKTIKYIKNEFPNVQNIIDLGTGSGCIAIALKKEFSNISMTAVDISTKALEVATSNALKNKVDINFICSDMFDMVTNSFDVIISNPPYIAFDEPIMDIVKNNEPKIALYAKKKGLAFYEKILKEAPKYINDKYLIAFEIGQTQALEITNLAHKYLGEVNVTTEKDMRGFDRFIFIRGGKWK